MLNIPNKSQLQSQSFESETTSKLEQLISLRHKINELEHLVKELMPDAINEALDIMNSNSSLNGKNIVYANKQLGKINIQFPKQYPSPKDNITLERLDADINAEQAKLSKTHKSELSKLEEKLEELNEEIEVIEKQQEELLTNKRLIKLKARFKTERENGMELIPSLSVYLNK